MPPKDFKNQIHKAQTVVLDVRTATEFAQGHIPNSIFIGLDGNFAPWVGELITDITQPLLIVSPKGREKETVMRLSRVGFDHTIGYLEGGIKTWKNEGFEIATIPSVLASEFQYLYSPQKDLVFDVRKTSEFMNGHIPKAINIPLAGLNQQLSKFPEKKPFYIHCKGGYRSMMAISILKSKGIKNMVDIKDGFDALKKTDVLNGVVKLA